MIPRHIVKAISSRSKGPFREQAKKIHPNDEAAQRQFIKHCAGYVHNTLAKDLWGEDLIREIILTSSGKPSHELTNREIQVLLEVCNDRTEKQIAKKLNISAFTVAFHKANIYKRIKVKGVAGLVKYAIREGYIDNLNQEA